MELPAYHRAVFVYLMDKTFFGGIPRPVLYRHKGRERGEDNVDEDTWQPCGGCRVVFPELVAVGSTIATYGGHGILYRHTVSGLYLYAHGGYMDVPAVEEQPNG